MTAVGDPEIRIRQRVIGLLQDHLGHGGLGDWRERPLPTRFLARQGPPGQLPANEGSRLTLCRLVAAFQPEPAWTAR